MPIYEYRCGGCGHVFEEMQTGFEERTETCPKCGQEGRRQMSSTSFILKGTGWYTTDYCRSSTSCSAKTNDSGDSAGSADSGGSTEAPAGGCAAGASCSIGKG